jgi:hypothetical protein
MSDNCIFCADNSIFEQDFSQPEKVTHEMIRAKGQFWLTKPKNRLVQPGNFENRKVGKYQQVQIPKKYLAGRWQGFTIELLGIHLDYDPPTASVYYPLFFRSHRITPTYVFDTSKQSIDSVAEWATQVGLPVNKAKEGTYISIGGGQEPPKVREDLAAHIEHSYVLYSAAKVKHDETGLLVKFHLWPSHGLIFSVENFNFFEESNSKVLKDALAIFSPGRGKPSEHFNDLREFDEVLRSTIIKLSVIDPLPKQEDVAQAMCGGNFTGRTLRKWLKKTTWLHFKWPEIVNAVLEDFNKKN